MVDLLRGHRGEGRRFATTELVEAGPRVAVGLAVTDPHWDGSGLAYKVFTFDESGRAVLLEDCKDRQDALAKLAS